MVKHCQGRGGQWHGNSHFYFWLLVFVCLCLSMCLILLTFCLATYDSRNSHGLYLILHVLQVDGAQRESSFNTLSWRCSSSGRTSPPVNSHLSVFSLDECTCVLFSAISVFPLGSFSLLIPPSLPVSVSGVVSLGQVTLELHKQIRYICYCKHPYQAVKASCSSIML